ncbi:MAG: LytR cell envelope-related transcriptional attenuator [Solirubrobacteraceae bacterium]|nr:LytR cell envelope-related transcriptional attenuator [Solirubrobacteraceae bacterium]
MTDFYAQLEEQLVSAGRRRRTQGRVSRAAAGRGWQLAGAVAAVAAIAAAVVVAVSGQDATRVRAPAPAGAGPSTVTVTVPARPSLRGILVEVFNGTPRTGLARTVADQLERADATVGAVGAGPRLDRARTSVRYRPGKRAQARRVAAVLGVSDVRRATAADGLAPAAAVRVLVGEDLRRIRPVVPDAPRPLPSPSAVPAVPLPPAGRSVPAAPVPLPAQPVHPPPATAPLPAAPAPTPPRALTAPAPTP